MARLELGPQPARYHAGPGEPQCQDRGVQATPPQPWQGRNPLHHLRAYGQWHLVHRARSYARWRTCARLQPREGNRGPLGRHHLKRSATVAPIPRMRSGTASSTSSARSFPLPRKLASRSASILTIPLFPSSVASPAASLVASRATSVRWRWLTAPMLGSASASVAGSRVALGWARMC